MRFGKEPAEAVKQAISSLMAAETLNDLPIELEIVPTDPSTWRISVGGVSISFRSNHQTDANRHDINAISRIRVVAIEAVQ